MLPWISWVELLRGNEIVTDRNELTVDCDREICPQIDFNGDNRLAMSMLSNGSRENTMGIQKCILYINKSPAFSSYQSGVQMHQVKLSVGLDRCTPIRLDQAPLPQLSFCIFCFFSQNFSQQKFHRLWAQSLRQTVLGIWQTALPRHRRGFRSFHILCSFRSFNDFP